jgi:flagellar basal body-associated protein FliL
MSTFLLILLVTVVLVAICFVAIGVQVFFSKKKKFPDTEIGHNAEMRKRNIKCAKCEELERCTLKSMGDCAD